MRRLFITLLLLLAPLGVCGCVAFRDETTGAVGVGIKLDDLPESAGQLLRAGADLLPPPFNLLAAGLGTLIVGGGGAAVASRAAKRAQAQADAAWDEADRRSREAHLLSAAAFDEGVHRATTISPNIPGTVSSVPPPTSGTTPA